MSGVGNPLGVAVAALQRISNMRVGSFSDESVVRADLQHIAMEALALISAPAAVGECQHLHQRWNGRHGRCKDCGTRLPGDSPANCSAIAERAENAAESKRLLALARAPTAPEWKATETRVYFKPVAVGFDLYGAPNPEANAAFTAAAHDFAAQIARLEKEIEGRG